MRATGRRPLVVVLGAGGFVGTVLARQLAERPIRLRLVSRGPTDPPPEPRADVEMCQADLTRIDQLADATADGDAILHVAAHIDGSAGWRVAERNTAAWRVNTGSMYQLVDVLRARDRLEPPVVLFAGSTSQAARSTSGEPLSSYDEQKNAAEAALAEATADGVARGATLRLPTLFDSTLWPRFRGVVAVMLRRALSDEPLIMWHDGSVGRDLLHVADAARAFVLALEHHAELAGQSWMIGTGQSTSVGVLFRMISEAVASVSGSQPVPVRSAEVGEHRTEADLVDLVFDSTAFPSVTGWAPRVRLEAALRQAACTALAEGNR